ncbi:MAG TPA: DUF3618 domain-containing protein [Verrucomicrobiales bacterium]|nr:DUF3618 domain-containing protein [Verrucomicrobiales bacterium]
MATHTLTHKGLAHGAGQKLKEGIEATRERMDRTVDALSEKLDPRQVVDGISDWVGNASFEDALESARKSVKQAASHVRRHPVPYTLAGAGMAWLAVELIRKHGAGADQTASTWTEKGEAAKEAVSGALHTMGESAGRAATEAKEAVATGAGKAGRTLARGYARASEACQDAFHTTKDKLSGRQDSIANVVAQNPLAVGGGLIALGVIAGILLPRTRAEDRWIGEGSERLLEGARNAGRAALQRGKDALHDVVESTKARAEAEGLTPEALEEKAENVIEGVKEDARKAANEHLFRG